MSVTHPSIHNIVLFLSSIRRGVQLRTSHKSKHWATSPFFTLYLYWSSWDSVHSLLLHAAGRQWRSSAVCPLLQSVPSSHCSWHQSPQYGHPCKISEPPKPQSYSMTSVPYKAQYWGHVDHCPGEVRNLRRGGSPVPEQSLEDCILYPRTLKGYPGWTNQGEGARI